MKAVVQTRILIGLTEDEARSAVNNSTDLQLAIRSALYTIDGRPIVELSKSKPALLAAPSRNGHKPKRKQVSPNKECPHCHEMRNPMGYTRHVKSCALKHPQPKTE